MEMDEVIYWIMGLALLAFATYSLINIFSNFS
ncbi:MAG: hypothetical protein ACI83O_000456 [Patescibacteria group bacterium]|jgi:hypothetical protein